MVKVRCQISTHLRLRFLACERQYSGVRKRIEIDGKYICQTNVFGQYLIQKKTQIPKSYVEL